MPFFFVEWVEIHSRMICMFCTRSSLKFRNIRGTVLSSYYRDSYYITSPTHTQILQEHTRLPYTQSWPSRVYLHSVKSFPYLGADHLMRARMNKDEMKCVCAVRTSRGQNIFTRYMRVLSNASRVRFNKWNDLIVPYHTLYIVSRSKLHHR